MALLDLELDRFDPVEQAWEQHVPELLQQWLARMVPTHAALSRTRTTILETATGSSHGSLDVSVACFVVFRRRVRSRCSGRGSAFEQPRL